MFLICFENNQFYIAEVKKDVKSKISARFLD